MEIVLDSVQMYNLKELYRFLYPDKQVAFFLTILYCNLHEHHVEWKIMAPKVAKMSGHLYL